MHIDTNTSEAVYASGKRVDLNTATFKELIRFHGRCDDDGRAAIAAVMRQRQRVRAQGLDRKNLEAGLTLIRGIVCYRSPFQEVLTARDVAHDIMWREFEREQNRRRFLAIQQAI